MNEVNWDAHYVTPSFDREDPMASHHVALRRGPVMLAQENRLGYSVDDPIFKNTNGILALSPAESRKPKPTACIHCGRCADTCPMGLNPTLYAKALKLDDPKDKVARLEAAKANLCIECGSCSYVCPANRPLVENNKLSKAAVRAAQAEKK